MHGSMTHGSGGRWPVVPASAPGPATVLGSALQEIEPAPLVSQKWTLCKGAVESGQQTAKQPGKLGHGNLTSEDAWDFMVLSHAAGPQALGTVL